MGTLEKLQQQIGQLFVSSLVENYVEIETPFLYPDGDFVYVFVEEAPDGIILSDLAETVGWLWMLTAHLPEHPRQREFIEHICRTYGVERSGGELRIRLKSLDELADAVVRLSQAALGVAHLCYVAKTQEPVAANYPATTTTAPKSGYVL